jgi:CRISPR/Cas system Type II protein with McrA/HNH and RuvC-like nuclease domain
MRTRQQLHEAAIKRRVGDLLLEGENQPVDIDDLFARFNNKCFKTGKVLDKDDRKSWAIDHILPSRWLYPLSKENAALLSAEANNKKRDGWPSNFYTNNERINLARITGADLGLLSRKEPVINEHIDVDECVTRYLQVREGSDLAKRIKELKKLLEDYDLVKKLSALNKRILGYDKK